MGRHFCDVQLLEPDDMVRWEGSDEVVERTEKSPDGHHFRVWFVGYSTYRVFPPTARFTLLNGPKLPVAQLSALPKCAFCDDIAKYDAPTRRDSVGHGSWAYMCQQHMDTHGVMTSVTTRLVLA